MEIRVDYYSKGNFTHVPQFKSGLNIKGDVRSISVLKNKDSSQIIVGINNSPALSLHVK